MFYRIVLIALAGINFGFSEISYPDFLVSMTRNGRDFRACEEIHDCYSIQSLQIFQIAYTRNVLLAKQRNEKERIPKIIHQIWLGSPLPERYFSWMRTWMDWLGWKYVLWTDEDVRGLSLYNQELYDQATNYGEKSDILRLELLLLYGGIYVDVDFECIKSEIFDEFHRHFDFYIGFEPLIHGTIGGTYKICNAIIGSVPFHPLVRKMIVHLKDNREAHSTQTAVEQTGPNYFSNTILAYEREQFSKKTKGYTYRNMYLPCTFFYPFSAPEVRNAISRESLLANVSPETAAVHYWSGSWHPEEESPSYP